MNQLTITLEKYQYIPGDQINGVVNLKLIESIANSSLVISIKGTIFTYIRKLVRIRDNYVAREFQNSENTLNESTTPSQGNFNSGESTYPFSFILPKELSPSFQYKIFGLEGSIKYQIDANVFFPNGMVFNFNEKKLKDFQICKPIISNLPPEPKYAEINASQYFCCTGGLLDGKKKGFVGLTLKLNQSIVSPGENLTGSVLVNTEKLEAQPKNIRIRLEHVTTITIENGNIKDLNRDSICSVIKDINDIGKGKEQVVEFSLTLPKNCRLTTINNPYINCQINVFVIFENKKKPAMIKYKRIKMPIDIVGKWTEELGSNFFGQNNGQYQFLEMNQSCNDNLN